MMSIRNYAGRSLLVIILSGFLLGLLPIIDVSGLLQSAEAGSRPQDSSWGDAFAKPGDRENPAPITGQPAGSGWNNVIDGNSPQAQPQVRPLPRRPRPERSFYEKTTPTPPRTKPAVAPTKIKLRPVPNVKFSAADPCAAAAQDTAGRPWEDGGKDDKIELPEGVNALPPPAIPDLEKLSDFSYNAAVSAAFEGMRLIYGPLSATDAKKFEALWSPLFDFPTQEIIDYLNRLNPLLSRFLSCREAYLRNLSAIQPLLLDAAFAIAMHDQSAWEAAMAEAEMYASLFPPLESGMKKIAIKIEKLGNPPNPNAEKCRRRRRYRALLHPIQYPFAGEWQSSDGKKFLLKVAHHYKDGKVLVYNFPLSWFAKMKAAGYRINAAGELQSQDGKLAMMPGVYDLLQVFEQLEPGVWVSENWTLAKVVYIYRVSGETMDVSEYSFFSKPPEKRRYTAEKTESSDAKPPVLNFDGGAKTWDDLLKVVHQDIWAGNKYKSYMRWREESSGDISVALAISPKNEKPETADHTTATATGDNDQGNENNNQAAASQAEQERKDAIATHTEMVKVVQKQLDREIAEREEVLAGLARAKTPEEAKARARRLKELNLRIIGFQSNLQAERDLVASYKTGKLIHTRTVFDNYARSNFIDGIRKNAARIDATRKIASRIDRQIELLPPEMRPAARRHARKILDAKTIASGNLERAKKLVSAFNEQIQGYAEYDHAQAQEAEVEAQENEFYSQMAIMAVGVGAVGVGSAALAETYGAEAAISIYGPQMLGAIYGGTTGLVAGGPKEGLKQALMWSSPKGFAAVQFFEGYEHAGTREDADTATKIWAGVERAGTAYFLGKTIELGVGLVCKGSLIAFGEESRLFKPLLKTSSQRARRISDKMLTEVRQGNAREKIETFERLEIKLAMLKRNPGINARRIKGMEADLEQLTAELNLDYHCKWFLKYKASPGLRRQFDLRCQNNYAEMTPGMVRRLEAQGYNMEEIEFIQYRNAASGGSSSMDLDLGPVIRGTRQEPQIIIKKDGSTATMKQFMNDAQAAMNAEYYELFQVSAPKSDMNLVTSVHPEAFSTPGLLEKNVDFANISQKDLASVRKVLKVKIEGISRNEMLTNTSKMQAKCREASKEIQNIKLKKLRSDLKNAPTGSARSQQIQSDIRYWEDMLKRFRQIGTEETNPMQIIELNREIIQQTGGRDVNGVINDLIKSF